MKSPFSLLAISWLFLITLPLGAREYTVTTIELNSNQGLDGSYVFSSAFNARGEFVILAATTLDEPSILLTTANIPSKLILWLPEPNYGLEAGLNEIAPSLDLRSPQLTEEGEIIAAEWELIDGGLPNHKGFFTWNAGSISRIPFDSVPHGIAGLTPSRKPIINGFRRAEDGDFRYSIDVAAQLEPGGSEFIPLTRFCRWSGSGAPSLSLAPPFQNEQPQRIGQENTMIVTAQSSSGYFTGLVFFDDPPGSPSTGAGLPKPFVWDGSYRAIDSANYDYTGGSYDFWSINDQSNVVGWTGTAIVEGGVVTQDNRRNFFSFTNPAGGLGAGLYKGVRFNFSPTINEQNQILGSRDLWENRSWTSLADLFPEGFEFRPGEKIRGEALHDNGSMVLKGTIGDSTFGDSNIRYFLLKPRPSVELSIKVPAEALKAGDTVSIEVEAKLIDEDTTRLRIDEFLTLSDPAIASVVEEDLPDPFTLTSTSPSKKFTLQVNVLASGQVKLSTTASTLNDADDPISAITGEANLVTGDLVVNVTGDESDADPDDGVIDVDLDQDGNQVTLRAAIEEANRDSDKTGIIFNIEGESTPVISPESPLPTIRAKTVINGNSQPGGGRVCIDGSAAPANSDGFRAEAETTFRGLEITNFKGGAGIRLTGARDHVISECALGTDFNDTPGLGNKIGILAEEVTHVKVGNLEKEEDPNVISGNEDGVCFIKSHDSKIVNSYIGTKRDGNTPMMNSRFGIQAENCERLTIGGPENVGAVMGKEAGFSAKEISDFTIEATNFGVGIDGSTTPPDMREGITFENCVSGRVTGSNVTATFAGIKIGRCGNLVLEALRVGVPKNGLAAFIPKHGILAEATENLTIGSDKGLSTIMGELAVKLTELTGPSNSLCNFHIGTDSDGQNAIAGVMKGIVMDNCENVTLEGKPGMSPDSSFGPDTHSVINATSTGIEVKNSENIQGGWFMVGTDASGTKSFRPNNGNFIGMLFQNSKGVRLGEDNASMLVNGPCNMLNLSMRPPSGGLAAIFNKITNLRVNLNALGVEALAEQLGHGICVEDSSDLTMEGIEIGQADTGIEVLGSSGIRIGAFSIGRIVSGLLTGGTLMKSNGEHAVTKGINAENSDDVMIGSEDDEKESHLLASVTASLTNLTNSGIFNLNAIPKKLLDESILLPKTHLEISGCEVLEVSKIKIPEFLGAFGIEISSSERVSFLKCEMGELIGDRAPGGLLPLVSTHLVARESSDLVFADNRISPFRITGDEDFLSIIDSDETSITGNTMGASEFLLRGSAINVSGLSDGIKVLKNRIQNTNKAAIKGGSSISRLIHRINELTGVSVPIELDLSVLQESLAPVVEAIFHDGSTHINGPVTGTPGKEITLDVYAFSPDAQGVQAEFHLGEHTITYDANGRADLAAVLDGSAPPGYLLTATLTDPDVGTSTFTSGITRSAIPDRDNDGLPDFWELQYPDCLDPDDPTDAQEDCDDDGRTNLEEYIAFTNPEVSDLASQPEALIQPDGEIEVSIEGKSGRTYCLMRTNNLMEENWEEVDRTFLTKSGSVQLKDPEPLPKEGYYRVVIELP